MEKQTDILGMLDLLTAPGFCVKEDRITKVNAAAAAMLFKEGMALGPLLYTGAEEYREFREGCLCIGIRKEETLWNAFVTRQGDTDVFVLEEDSLRPELRTLALAARELRTPLSNAMLITGRLLGQEDPELVDQISRLNRGLHQILRIVGNMSDAGSLSPLPRQTMHDVPLVLEEIMDKARALTEAAGLTLRYTGLPESILSLCDPEQLERAVLNILSNAIKFSSQGGTIEAALTRSGHMLRLSILDNGSGISDNLLRSVFYRYLRQPAVEDSRHGIGLGMVLIRTAALQHGGTVLIDQPEGTGTRVTLTLAIRQDEPVLSSNILYPLSGGYDSTLIELSEVLPAEMYNGKK